MRAMEWKRAKERKIIMYYNLTIAKERSISIFPDTKNL